MTYHHPHASSWFRPRLSCVLLGFGLLLTSIEARAEVVYDNTTSPYDQFWGAAGEFGDEINLGGTAITLTKFQCEYYGNFTPNGQQFARVRFYANDGEGHESSVGLYGKPKTKLYESWPIRINPGYNVLTLRDLSLPVPDRFTWTVEFDGMSFKYGDSAGLVLYNPPTLGSSYNDFWVNQSDGWEVMHFYGYKPVANFAARVEATPETPATVKVLGYQSDGAAILGINGPAYRGAVLESSSDTVQWTALRQILFQGVPITWVDNSDPANTNRQYRLRYVVDPLLELSLTVSTNKIPTIQCIGTPGQIVVVEGSADLKHWSGTYTNYLNAAVATFTDYEAANQPHVAYRAWFDGYVLVHITSSQRLANGMVLLGLSGPPGRDCRIESTTNLKTWTTEDVQTFSFTGGLLNYLDSSATNTAVKYYRAIVPE